MGFCEIYGDFVTRDVAYGYLLLVISLVYEVTARGISCQQRAKISMSLLLSSA